MHGLASVIICVCMLSGYCVMKTVWKSRVELYPSGGICVGFNWEDAYPVARACDLIDDKIGSVDTFRPN